MLPVASCRVVKPEEVVQNFRIGNLGGVENQPHGLGVSGPARCHITVGWVLGVTADVTNLGREHTIEIEEEVLDSPKAPRGEDGLLAAGGCPPSLSRNTRSRAQIRLQETRLDKGRHELAKPLALEILCSNETK